MRLFLVRHGAVIPPAPGAFYGGTDVALSEVGKREARRAAELLEEEPLQAIYSSPLSRARYGAERVADRRAGVGIRVVEGLREIDRGRWLGLTAAEVEERYPGDLGHHAADPEKWREHGGESMGDLRDRVLRVRDALVAQHDGAAVAVVSHLFPTRAILADALGLDLPRWSELELPTGSVSLVEYAGTRAEVRWVGRVAR